jgi:hypothetical protein
VSGFQGERETFFEEEVGKVLDQKRSRDIINGHRPVEIECIVFIEEIRTKDIGRLENAERINANSVRRRGVGIKEIDFNCRDAVDIDVFAGFSTFHWLHSIQIKRAVSVCILRDGEIERCIGAVKEADVGSMRINANIGDVFLGR